MNVNDVSVLVKLKVIMNVILLERAWKRCIN